MKIQFDRRRGVRTLAIAVAAACVFALCPPGSLATTDRSEQPVLVPGASLPDFAGLSIADLGLFRYDDVGGQYVPIPFQIDEVIVDRVFRPGTSFEFTQTIYDIYGEDDGLLDANDELAFRFGDAGPQAAAGAWVGGAGVESYEIEIADPRAGAPFATRHVYLFTGSGLPTSATSYVNWTVSATTDATTDLYSLEYQDRWLLLGYKVASPCGTGADMLDRFKVRAGAAMNNAESEQTFNNSGPPTDSTFLGGISGPVRAVRYIMGAASGVNTIHHDMIYRGLWERHTNLRVHLIQQVFAYLDWLPATGATLYLPDDPSGITIDGSPDTPTGWDACSTQNPGNPAICSATPPLNESSVPPWAVYRSSIGGMAILFDVPPSPFYNRATGMYLDDSTFPDSSCTPQPACYPDDDDIAHDFGVLVGGPASQCCNSIYTRWSMYALCSDTGDATLGADYQEFVDSPLGLTTVAEWEILGPIGTVDAQRSGDDIVLDWDAVNGATGYRVYESEFADLPRSSWTSLGETATPDFTDTGAALSSQPRHYSVIALTPGSEGDH